MKSLQIMMMGNNSSEGLGYGYLYNWYTVSDAKFAPSDWKVPSLADYSTLKTYLGGYAVAGGKLKESGTTHWLTPNTDADNSSGFTGWAGGSRTSSVGTFIDINERAIFWGSNSSDYRSLTLKYNDAQAGALESDNRNGYSVRLLYTGSGTPSTVTDYDGNVYDTVVIGTQRWTVQNWKCTHLNDGTALTKVTDATAWAAKTSEAYCAYDNDESNV